MKDKELGHNIAAKRADWTFGGNVADTFVPHIRQSVPLYDEGHDLVCYLSDFFCAHDSICYELGVSTGQLIEKLATYNSHKPEIKWIGIDNEEPMIEAAKKHCSKHSNIFLYCDDILLYDFEKSDLFISYYTMQFVKPKHRQTMFNKTYECLNWGGAFILFEKVRGPDARFQDIMVSLYNDFKLRNGFSSDEVISKAQSLKGVLEPFSTQGNIDLLKRAGFEDIVTIQKYICFEGFLAIK